MLCYKILEIARVFIASQHVLAMSSMVSKDFILETVFQKFVLSGLPARCCHVKERPNHNKSVSFEAKTCTMLSVS